MIIIDPAVTPRIDAERLCTTLGLTQAESRLAAALAQGTSVRDVAAATGRAESSVRWLIKQIHQAEDLPEHGSRAGGAHCRLGLRVATLNLKPPAGENDKALMRT